MKLEQGDNKFRIMDKPAFGWLAWTIDEEGHNKPLRFQMNEKPTDLREFREQKLSHVWMLPVWNFQTKSIQILEVTQKSLQKALEALARNEDWGSPLRYNITIRRQGEKLDTEYFVNPSPHSDAPAEAREAWSQTVKNGFDITRLFKGEDPFAPNPSIDGEDAPAAAA
ncbi:hypothetical protein [Amorphus orientalis]|uniref:Uncharacterized protein n=1 Tax=Amorphus orientalis TaxID=649198 RepID=A0AAE3VR99_9HYPH|nr:hypothetical protein [Amorphus orientalis]MDQ0316390.1 hypothetical protein [Amorphus orientalis]